jgi:hypothetical protein
MTVGASSCTHMQNESTLESWNLTNKTFRRKPSTNHTLAAVTLSTVVDIRTTPLGINVEAPTCLVVLTGPLQSQNGDEGNYVRTRRERETTFAYSFTHRECQTLPHSNQTHWG